MKRKRTLQFAIKFDDGYYFAESLDIPVVTQGETLDEITDNIREAVTLHLEGETPETTGIERDPAIIISYETEAASVA